MTPTLRQAVLGAFLMLATGCAGSPPAAPLAETAPGEPSGIRIPLFKWEPNKRLAYDQKCFAETTVGGKKSTESTRGSDSMTGLERTARGLIQVRLVNDGTELGFLFFDEEGHAQDMTVTRQGRDADAAVTRGVLAGALELLKVRERMLTTDLFLLNERKAVETSFGHLLTQPGIELNSGDTLSLRGTIEYVGYKQLGTTRAAALRTEMSAASLPVRVRVKSVGESLVLRVLHVDGTEYIHLEYGFLVSSYTIMTMELSVGSQALLLRTSCLRTLNRQDSRGI